VSGVITPAGNDNAWDAIMNPTGAVVLEQVPATVLEPAKAVVWCKLQCWNYQYIHRWEFRADGSIEAGVGLGGQLWTTNPPTMGHVHNFYFRLDFDMVSAGNNLVQEFSHPGNNPGQDGWQDIKVEVSRTRNLGQATKWRVINKAAKPNGQVRSYELTPGSDMGPDGTYSTADLWVLQYDASQDGAAVGFTDQVLGSSYLHGVNASVDGKDVVVWHCLRHHHEPRQLGEETSVLPYEYLSFHIEPRDFLDATPKNLYTTNPPSPI
jgi:primary-amine oxidase